MKFETIKDCGEFGIEFSIKDGEGTRVSKEFLQLLIRNIIKRSTEYFDATESHIFFYKEKQLHSVVCPSIADLTPSYVIEHPITRKPRGEEEYSGKCDYWISYRNYSYVMELKHSFFAYRNIKSPRQDISNKFNRCLDQLKEIKRGETRNLAMNKGTIKIALQAIVFFRSSQNTIRNDESEEQDIEDAFELLIQNSDLKESNVRSLWILHDRLFRAFEYDNGYEIFPAVAFVGKIFDVILK
ncbi:MAG: hypothetical protein WA130_11085 [Candidatus Methanoperedens sp.]